MPDQITPLDELLTRPQRLGFLPTAAFWADGDGHRSLRWPVIAVKVLALVGIDLVLRNEGFGPAALGPLALFAVGAFFGLGLFQKLLRWQARR